MRNVNYIYDDGFITSIRHKLQIIQNVLIDGDDEVLKIETGSSSSAALLTAIHYLEEAKDQTPHYYGKQIDFLVREVRSKLSLESNFTHDYKS